MSTVDTTFPLVEGRDRGYSVESVNEFFTKAREEYNHPDGVLGSADIRRMAFPLTRGGYVPESVDEAMNRLEQAFAERERADALVSEGAVAWREHARDQARVVVNRLSRPDRHKFRRAGVMSIGYRRRDVDAFARRIIAVFVEGTPLSPDEVREIVFAREGNGYDEAQVDALLDRTIEILLAIA